MGLVLRINRKKPVVNVYDREGRKLTVKLSNISPTGNVELWFDGDDFTILRDGYDPAKRTGGTSSASSP